MCYYSKTLRRDEFRNAKKEGEDLVIHSDYHGHHYPVAKTDGKIVCILSNTSVHFEKLELEPMQMPQIVQEFRYHGLNIADFKDKPFDGMFWEGNGGYSIDRILISKGGFMFGLHLIYIKEGTKFYTGAKRPDVVKLTGVDDPSIALDHKPVAPAEPEKVWWRELLKA